jgi:hypothetical protein
MNEITFNSPTILKGTQYGKTITIELDHSDTSIDEVMDGFLTILNGLGYLPTTINDYFKDKVKDIWEDEHQIVKDALCTDENFDDYDPEEVIWDCEENNQRMDIIGQNGNEGTHYDKNEDNDVNVWGDEEEETYLATDEDIEECELNDKLELPTDEYKGIYVEKPRFDWDDEELDWPVANEKLKAAAQKYSEEVKAKHVPIGDFDVTHDADGGFAVKMNAPLYKKIKKEQWSKMDKTKMIKGKIKDLKG